MIELNVRNCFAMNNRKCVGLTMLFIVNICLTIPCKQHAVVNGFSRAVGLLAPQQANRVPSSVLFVHMKPRPEILKVPHRYCSG